LKVHKHAQVAQASRIQTASLYVEKVAGSRTVFAALTSGPTSGTNLNPDFINEFEPQAELAWTSVRKDAGFTHSDGAAGINLSTGTYLVFANVPVASAVQRAAPGLEVTLNDVAVPGGYARQGYIRNTGGHAIASVHWSGLVQVSGNQTLKFLTSRRGQAGAVTIQPGKQGSVYVEKIDSSRGVLFTSAVEVDATDPLNWNPADKSAIRWKTADAIGDSAAFSHSGGNGGIQVRQAGSYLLVYNDTLQSTVERPNPRITVEVNGVLVKGAETKTHYIRSLDGHNTASASLVFLLEDLAANDVITVSTQREANTGTVTQDEFAAEAAILALIKKDTLTLPAGDTTPPRVVFFSGGLFGFTLRMQDLGISVNPSSLQSFWNGTPIEATVTKSGGLTTVSYEFPTFPNPGSTQTIKVTFQDTGSPAGTHQAEFPFVIATQFARIPTFFKASGVDAASSGFVANMTQVSIEQSLVDSLHGNSIAGAEKQLAGELLDPLTGKPWFNEADPSSNFGSPWKIAPVNVDDVINFEQAGGSAGNFNSANGAADKLFPNIPGAFGLDNGIVGEFITFLELKKGFHTLGVNSDDGFKVSSGPSTKDQLAATLGFFDGNRGSADTLFNVVVDEDGVYPFRLLWFEGNGGANLEFFSVVDGEKILINDRKNPKAFKAYRTAQGRPYVSSFGPVSGELSRSVAFEIHDADLRVVEGSVRLSIDGTDRTSGAQINKSGSVTTVAFDNGDFFSGGEHTATLTYDESSTPVVTRRLDHTFRVPKGMAAVLVDQPFAYWPLGEQRGAKVDSEVGSGLSSALFGEPTLGADRVAVGASSTAILFEASKRQYIDIPDHPEINDSPNNPGWKEKTVELWFRARNLPTSDPLGAGAPESVKKSQIIYEQGGVTRGITIYLRGTQPGPSPTEAELWINVLNRAEQIWGGTLPNEPQDANGNLLSPNGDPVAVSTRIVTNTPYHVVLVMEGDDSAPDSFEGKITGYLNGAKFGEAKGAHLLYDHSDDIAIGARNEEMAMHDFLANGTWNSEWYALGDLLHFDGTVDEVAMYNTALSEDRVKAHYQAGITEVPLETGTGGGGSGGVPTISVARAAAGSIQIEFSGTLQSAPSVTGPWTDVGGASPASISTSEGARFFRAR
jgi:hypothetical protein